MAEPIGERMARVETQLGEIVRRLDTHDDATANLSTKLDAILANQMEAANTSQILRADIEKMKPHIDTVADFKKFTTFGKLTIGIGVAALSALAFMKSWLILNWQWFTGR